jgi:hypothetical protein
VLKRLGAFRLRLVRAGDVATAYDRGAKLLGELPQRIADPAQLALDANQILQSCHSRWPSEKSNGRQEPFWRKVPDTRVMVNPIHATPMAAKREQLCGRGRVSSV